MFGSLQNFFQSSYTSDRFPGSDHDPPRFPKCGTPQRRRGLPPTGPQTGTLRRWVPVVDLFNGTPRVFFPASPLCVNPHRSGRSFFLRLWPFRLIIQLNLALPKDSRPSNPTESAAPKPTTLSLLISLPLPFPPKSSSGGLVCPNPVRGQTTGMRLHEVLNSFGDLHHTQEPFFSPVRLH